MIEKLLVPLGMTQENYATARVAMVSRSYTPQYPLQHPSSLQSFGAGPTDGNIYANRPGAHDVVIVCLVDYPRNPGHNPEGGFAAEVFQDKSDATDLPRHSHYYRMSSPLFHIIGKSVAPLRPKRTTRGS